MGFNTSLEVWKLLRVAISTRLPTSFQYFLRGMETGDVIKAPHDLKRFNTSLEVWKRFLKVRSVAYISVSILP